MALGDPHFDKVSLLLRFNATADNATNVQNPASDFIDLSPNRLTPASVTSVRLRTSVKMEGTGSAEIWNWDSPPGLQYAPGQQFDFGTGDFTFELGYRPNGVNAPGGAAPTILGGSAISLISGAPFGTGVGVRLAASNLAYAPALPANVFTKIMLSRASGVFRLFYNGVLQLTDSNNVGVAAAAGAAFRVGSLTTDRAFGFYDEVRITKGVARATSNYTPSAGEFPNYAAQLMGNVKDISGANAVRLVRAYREDTGSLVASAMSDGSTGNYLINATVITPHTLVFYPAAGEATLPAIVLRGVIPE